MELKKLLATEGPRCLELPASRTMTTKILLWTTLWAGSWGLLIFLNAPAPVKFLLALFHMTTHIFITLNIAHDANHGAITQNPFFRELLKRSFDLVGTSSYCWRMNHNKLHHHWTSIPELDPTSNGRNILRFHQSDKKLFFHRYQHLYAIFIYLFVTIYIVFFRDFLDFFRLLRKDRTSLTLWFHLVECVFFKMVYLSYTLVVPLFLLPYTPGQIIGTFFLCHFLLGPLVILIQVPHFNNNISAVSETDMSEDWEKNFDFILKHTSDIAPQSRIWNWLLGGINTHIAHHLYPGVCHVHLPAVTDRIREACKAEGKKYPHIDSVTEGWISHFSYLKRMGR